MRGRIREDRLSSLGEDAYLAVQHVQSQCGAEFIFPKDMNVEACTCREVAGGSHVLTEGQVRIWEASSILQCQM